ncbi:P-loop containing nucleoside triphosphate hydrolase protein [Penicillium capsulatum]|uniref:P-loop containing nucleoside triphosphate hydrolase protein n=1 Tax=Penicillium capsulatum TaxID=69766 RepID=A0A9W9IRN9_9EURO|nr:P-loop containing nucleoside triphosphate hydrolase protein [Penicillium capsulatum]KAJ6129476.1 P-loop containing nucleoside triphosphate hydrolase protein [Penicillium capsulatum]
MESLLSQRDARVAELEQQMKAQQAAHEEMAKQKEQLEKVVTDMEEREKTAEAERQRSRSSDEDAAQEIFTYTPSSDYASVKAMIQTDFGPRSADSVALYGSRYVCSCRKKQISPCERKIGWNRAGSLQQRSGKGSAGWLDIPMALEVRSGSTCRKTEPLTDLNPVQSTSVSERCPELTDKIARWGLAQLDFFALGPHKSFFVRWDGDGWSCAGPTDFECDIKKFALKIKAMAFGAGNSYVLSYGSAWNPGGLNYRCVLKGYYPDLEQFIEKNKSMEIQAIALDPLSQTDYILIWTSHHGYGSERIRCFCSSPGISAQIYNWWNDTAGLRE